MYIQFNPNPQGTNVGDCTIRAISKALNKSWEETYMRLCLEGFHVCDMPSANRTWGSMLRRNGFKRSIIPDTCPECYTVAHFAQEHPKGVYILALSGHVVCVKDGDWYDSWDSGNGVPIYYWEREA